MSEATIIDFVQRAAPVIRQLERNTGRAARSQAIAVGVRDHGVFYSHRSVQRLLNLAELFGYIERNGIKGGYRLPSVLPQPADLRPCFRQLELPFAAAA
jgi:hypothetical protein